MRVFRRFSKLKVPEGFSGDLKLLSKTSGNYIRKGEIIALIGEKSLIAHESGLVLKCLSEEGSEVFEDSEIYQVIRVTSKLKAVSLLTGVLGYLFYESLAKEEPKDLNQVNTLITTPKPKPQANQIKRTQELKAWLSMLEEPFHRGVEVVQGPKGTGKSTFMQKLAYTLSKSGRPCMYYSFYGETSWSSFYRSIGVQANDCLLLKRALESLTNKQVPVLIFDNAELSKEFLASLLEFSEKGLAKVILVSSDSPYKPELADLTDDLNVHLFDYPHESQALKWMKQLDNSIPEEDLKLYLEYWGSLSGFIKYTLRHKDLNLKEYLYKNILLNSKLLEEVIYTHKGSKELLKQLCKNCKQSFPPKRWVLELEKTGFIRRHNELYTFNSRIAEAALKVYCEELTLH